MPSIKLLQTITQEVDVEFALCINCDSENITFTDQSHGYSSPAYAAQCQKCSSRLGSYSSQADAIHVWNQNNDLDKQIDVVQSDIAELTHRLVQLTAQRERRSVQQEINEE